MTPKRSEVPVTPLGRKPAEPQTPAGLIAAGSLADRNMVIGKGLQRFVLLHLARHLSRLSLSRPCPRYAIVQGAPGCGKTSSIEKIPTSVPFSAPGVGFDRLYVFSSHFTI